MNRQQHWDDVYNSKPADQLSWFQHIPSLSIELIKQFAKPVDRVIDIGGGESVLVEHLLELGFTRPAVLDISEIAIRHLKERLGCRAEQVDWYVNDVTANPSIGVVDLWHDRAVFHFLTTPSDQQAYVAFASRHLKAGGHLVLATFALDGPVKCSGLDTARYDAATASSVLGGGFRLVHETREIHSTPWGKPQQFFYGVFQRQ